MPKVASRADRAHSRPVFTTGRPGQEFVGEISRAPEGLVGTKPAILFPASLQYQGFVFRFI